MDVSVASAAVALQTNQNLALASLKQTNAAEQQVVALLAQSQTTQSLPTPPAGRGAVMDFLA